MRRSATSRRRAQDQSARYGDEVRLARTQHGMTIRQASDLANVAWSTWARAEHGDPNIGLAAMCAIGESVGLDVVVRAYPGRRPSLRDTGQLELAEQVCTEAAPAWTPNIELQVGPHGEAIDTCLFSAGEIIAIEVERLLADFQGQYRRADRKRQMLAVRHQRPVRLVMAIEDRERNRSAVAPHDRLIRSVLPAGSREVLKALRTGRPLGRDGVLWIRRRPASR